MIRSPFSKQRAPCQDSTYILTGPRIIPPNFAIRARTLLVDSCPSLPKICPDTHQCSNSNSRQVPKYHFTIQPCLDMIPTGFEKFRLKFVRASQPKFSLFVKNLSGLGHLTFRGPVLILAAILAHAECIRHLPIECRRSEQCNFCACT